MAPSGNIVVICEDESRVYLYTHEGGHELAAVLRRALNHRRHRNGARAETTRWRLPAYLARVIFAQLTKGDEDGVLGYGISTSRIAAGGPELHVDAPLQVVRLVDVTEAADPEAGEVAGERVRAEWTFEQFARGLPPRVEHDATSVRPGVPP